MLMMNKSKTILNKFKLRLMESHFQVDFVRETYPKFAKVTVQIM